MQQSGNYAAPLYSTKKFNNNRLITNGSQSPESMAIDRCQAANSKRGKL